MNVRDFEDLLLSEMKKAGISGNYRVLFRTNRTLRSRIQLLDGSYIDAWFNEQRQKAAVAWIKGRKRILGINNAPTHPQNSGKDLWHMHAEGTISPLDKIDLRLLFSKVKAEMET